MRFGDLRSSPGGTHATALAIWLDQFGTLLGDLEVDLDVVRGVQTLISHVDEKTPRAALLRRLPRTLTRLVVES